MRTLITLLLLLGTPFFSFAQQTTKPAQTTTVKPAEAKKAPEAKKPAEGKKTDEPKATKEAVQTTSQVVEAAPMPLSPGVADSNAYNPSMVSKVAVMAGLSLLPFAIMLLTSFTKIVVVLSLLRQALGVQQTPPNQVLNGIALLVSIYVMFPTALKMYNAAEGTIVQTQPKDVFSGEAAAYVIEVIDKSKEPLRDFLQNNVTGKHSRSFYNLAYKLFPDPYRAELKPNDFIILIPSFITSQLKGAFEIGVLIYLPFFVIDLVVSNILLAMGMMMLSPLTIALPIKLLLIVVIDGWTVLVQALAMTFR